MAVIKLYILSVAIAAVHGGAGVEIRFNEPHKFYPSLESCEKAGRQWERNVKNAYNRNNGTANFSCEEQVILVPSGEEK